MSFTAFARHASMAFDSFLDGSNGVYPCVSPTVMKMKNNIRRHQKRLFTISIKEDLKYVSPFIEIQSTDDQVFNFRAFFVSGRRTRNAEESSVL
ncbi:hypothetical protein CEXT_695101 [Caerostris extrusa]|uniref:Uncharacterized protein n=1 Tax=Caerostris extrusa TaxID=172846 RepID=A0AAV4X2Y9_CAEEX|nr:hypothetical protein CEXT_695101 [Caerostris extrusa]